LQRTSSTDYSKEPNMTTRLTLGRLIALPVLGLALASAALAADYQSTPAQNVRIDDFAAGKKALDAKNWAQAVSSFTQVVSKNPGNADAYNYLGYANRWMGNYDAAFAAYGRALALNPAHKGALSYSGIAYVKTNQTAQAEAQLAKLQQLCAGCEETSALAQALAAAQTSAAK
jgi:Flp pilus assembly protein TadD